MKNSADLGECYPPRPSASVDNTLLDLQNSSYPTQPHSIIAKYGINKGLLLLNEHGDPSFLFPNLSSYSINNQLAKFEKNLSVGSISVE